MLITRTAWLVQVPPGVAPLTLTTVVATVPTVEVTSPVSAGIWPAGSVPPVAEAVSPLLPATRVGRSAVVKTSNATVPVVLVPTT